MTDQPKNVGHRYQKGQSGNPSGKSKLKPLTDRLRMILSEHPERAQKIAEALISEAENGNLQATNIVLERLEGKPMQQLNITDERQTLEIAEIDRRITELAGRLRVPIPALIDSTASDAEVVND